jgi:hypothetical protein
MRLSLTFSSSDEQITGGSNHLTVKYGFITVINESWDACAPPVTCPIPKGPYKGNLVPQFIPVNAPSVSALHLVVLFTNSLLKNLTCYATGNLQRERCEC